MYYNVHRYYDATTGQYLSSDPIGLAGGLRTRGYVENPLTWVDPLGLNGCSNGANSTRIAPNAAASEVLSAQNATLDAATHYCTECALNLSKAAGGEGKVVIFSNANAKWPAKYNWGMGGNVRVPSAQGPVDFAYHSVYTDGRYFYDPLLSKTPIPQAQYTDMLKSLNPNGTSWRIYNPNIQNPAVPQLQKGGF